MSSDDIRIRIVSITRPSDQRPASHNYDGCVKWPTHLVTFLFAYKHRLVVVVVVIVVVVVVVSVTRNLSSCRVYVPGITSVLLFDNLIPSEHFAGFRFRFSSIRNQLVW